MKNAYKTKDLAEASFLLANGKKLLLLERDGRVCWFVYPDRTECETLVSSFWFNDAVVNAKNFYDAIQMLKGRIFSQI